MTHAAGRETVARISRFGDLTEAHKRETHRLEVLNAVEQTMDILASERLHVSTLADHGEMLIERIETSPFKEPIDPEDEMIEKLRSTETGIRDDVLRLLNERRESVVRDPRLEDELEDGIVAAYDDLIAAWTRVHNSFVNLRWAVMEHDADLDESTGNTYESPEDLINALSA